MKITRKNFAGTARALAEAQQSAFILNWPVQETYRIVNARVYADGHTSHYVKPLENDDFFISFARLAARGEPSDASIKRWVTRYGLLTRDEAMELRSFRSEARRAHDLLVLYRAVKERDTATIRKLLSDIVLEDQPDNTVIEVGLTVFEEDVKEKLMGVSPSFAIHVPKSIGPGRLLSEEPELAKRLSGIENPSKVRILKDEPHPATVKPYVPSPSWQCDDLLSALYLQLYLMAIGHTSMRECEGCAQPFFLTRPDKRHCNATCRQRARQKKRHSE